MGFLGKCSETESAEEEREGVVANSANLRIGPGRASGSRTARTEATGGEDGDTHWAKSACQAAPAVTSQGVPRGDLIGGSQKAQLQKSGGTGQGAGHCPVRDPAGPTDPDRLRSKGRPDRRSARQGLSDDRRAETLAPALLPGLPRTATRRLARGPGRSLPTFWGPHRAGPL